MIMARVIIIIIIIIIHMETNVSGQHNRVGTIMYGHKRVWHSHVMCMIVWAKNHGSAQTCVDTNVSGHWRVGTSI